MTPGRPLPGHQASCGTSGKLQISGGGLDEGVTLRGRGSVLAGLIRQPLDNSYEACVEESRLVMLTCAKGAMKAAHIDPREARTPGACHMVPLWQCCQINVSMIPSRCVQQLGVMISPCIVAGATCSCLLLPFFCLMSCVLLSCCLLSCCRRVALRSGVCA